MKLVTGISMLGGRNVEKTLSKKILLANTSDKLSADKKVMQKSIASPSDPIYFQNSGQTLFNPDIRFQNIAGYSPMTAINYRNDLLVFSENNEIKKAVNVLVNETVVSSLKSNKYPLYPLINLTNISEDKRDVAKAIQKYLDEVFYPKLFQMAGFKNKGLSQLIEEFLKTGKTAFEIVYDNIKSPKDIVGLIPIDPSTLQKFKQNGYTYYLQKPFMDAEGTPRILHENQVILIEWNEYDFGYTSYVDTLRRPFNIMRSMQTSKILWFAVKSQVRMHIKLALGDIGRQEATQKLSQFRSDFINTFVFDEGNGVVNFNGKPNSSGYREFFTAETTGSGAPEIEEVNTNGPDLSEVDSLSFFEKFFWKETQIPFDRIDPNSSETWGFVDVSNVRKIELNFAKFVESIRDHINEIVLKPIIIQLTLKEIEIGIDLSLLDSITIEWVAFNEYDKLGELEILNKKVEIITALAAFGEIEDSEGKTRKAIPIKWLMQNYLDFTPEQLESMEVARRQEAIELGFAAGGNEDDSENEDTSKDSEGYTDEENEGDDAASIVAADDLEFDNEVL